MKKHLLVGLGNPSPKYDGTRHNVGRLILSSENFWKNLNHTNEVSSRQKISIPSLSEAEIYKTKINSQEIIFALDLGCYMNQSGTAVQAISSYLKITPDNIILVHDEIDLPLGTVRTSQNSSSAGHNGVQSVINSLGTKKFTRIRIGVETRVNKNRPSAETFVLQKFSSNQIQIIESKIVEATAKKILELLV